ncbi:MAG: hypothetical protein C4527_28235 [Candidatus Omnitrophota bacterium]|jgi:hypothetical protein|nr:MAG: hypothetical protein C4527_28235 [Candidatus Omnitrophota bacterium]
MDIVCKKCKRILRNGQWIEDILPIQVTSSTICPQCKQKESEAGKPSTAKGMIYQEYVREKKSDR